MFSKLENKGGLYEFESRDATFLENEFPRKENIKNKSSLRELNKFELSSTSDVLVVSLLNGSDIGTEGNLRVPIIHDHQDRHMQDANDDQNDNGDQEEVLMNVEELT